MGIDLALITGAPGWLGTRLARILRDGLPDVPGLSLQPAERRVRCLVLPGVSTEPLTEISSDIEVVRGDVSDPDSLRPFFAGAEGSTLFHLCGVIHPRRVSDFYRINVQGTRNILEASAASGVRRVIAVSSNSPAGYRSRTEPLLDESSPYRPYMHYGRSKMLMEREVMEAVDNGKLEAVILRPCWYYGPEQPQRQTRFFSMIRRGLAPIVSGGNSLRSMSYIDNTCQGALLAASHPGAVGRTYWIADRRPYSMNEIVGTVERLLEEEFGITVAHRRLRLPGVASRAAFFADWLIQGTGFYNQEIHVLSEMNKTIACSIELARKELGYEPLIELEEGMRRSIRWCLGKGREI